MLNKDMLIILESETGGMLEITLLGMFQDSYSE